MERTTGAASQGRSTIAAEVLATLSLVVSSAGLSISLAALLFAGPLSDVLARGTTAFLVGSGLACALIAFRSALPTAISPAQDSPAIVLVAVVANVIAGRDNVTVAEVMVVLALASLLTGLVMYLLGRFSLARIVRFLPAVVINAFVAGTGWLLLVGGIQVTTGESHGLGDLGGYIDGGSLAILACGIMVGFVAYLLSSWPGAPNGAVAASVALVTVAFYAIVGVTSSLQRVEDDNWLIGPFTSGRSLSTITPTELVDAPWADIVPQLPGLAAVAAVATLAVMLNLTGLESVAKQRIDIDEELKVNGAANMAQSIFGAIPVYPAIGFTTLAIRMGVTKRRVAVVVGLITAALGVVGVGLVGYVPRFVVGGLLMAVGLSLLLEWVDQMRQSISRVDWMISLIIIGCIAVVGVLEGILVGVVIACGVFIVRYSRVDPIRRVLIGTVTRSQVDRTPLEVERLVDHGRRTRVVELQGYLFFGSMTPVTDRVRSLCERDASGDDDSVEHLVLDFRYVTGIDGSALRLLRGLVVDLTNDGVVVVVSAASPLITSRLSGDDNGPELVASLDEALAGIEERILADEQMEAPTGLAPELLAAFESRTIPAGETVMSVGDDADLLLYLTAGTVSAYVAGNGGQPFRLRRFSGPGWVGEIGFLQRGTRSADIVADTELQVAVIDRSGFDRLRADQPDVVVTLLDDIAREQGKRVVTLSSALAQSAG